ncbi:tyrosine-type recombinase/integrase [Cohnella sp. GCM10012308]|uniref:tyrosine-type recombinase/integrase n=1 Tax=Cohnella sp. GCM10012308 TaxID=3317329 RepID=UPI0036089430
MKGGVRKRGNTWYYYFDAGKIDGERNKVEYPADGATSKAEALSVLRRKMTDFENTGTIFRPSEISVHDYLKYWMREYVDLKLKPNTQYNYESLLRLHILPVLGNYKLKSLSPHLLQQFMNGKVREGFARQTLSILIGLLNKALRHAVYPYKFISENPMQYVELVMGDTEGKPTREDLKIQSKENLRKLSKHFQEGHPFHIPYQIGLHTGVRVGEVCGLEWKHVDFDAQTITIEQQLVGRQTDRPKFKNGKKGTEWIVGPPKSKAGYRTIAIGKTLLDILWKEKHRQEQNQLRYGEFYLASSSNDFVCRKESGEVITPAAAKYHTGKASEALGIDFNYHSLRHTHATMLIEQKLPTKSVQKRLGHSRAAITEDRYVHLTQKMAREAADIFDSLASDL